MAIEDAKDRDSIADFSVGDVSVLHGSTPSLHASCNVTNLAKNNRGEILGGSR